MGGGEPSETYDIYADSDEEGSDEADEAGYEEEHQEQHRVPLYEL